MVAKSRFDSEIAHLVCRSRTLRASGRHDCRKPVAGPNPARECSNDQSCNEDRGVTPMQVVVATRERRERFAIPQTPCPLVQPEPWYVPKPTNNPATPYDPVACVNWMAPGPNRIAGGEKACQEREPPAVSVSELAPAARPVIDLGAWQAPALSPGAGARTARR
jgi:hypothetical protein